MYPAIGDMSVHVHAQYVVVVLYMYMYIVCAQLDYSTVMTMV